MKEKHEIKKIIDISILLKYKKILKILKYIFFVILGSNLAKITVLNFFSEVITLCFFKKNTHHCEIFIYINKA